MTVVGVGGGHGLARALAALRLLGRHPTAVVTVADDGGSSGRLRDDHGIVALGDMRMALLALATDVDLAAVLGHRFSSGDLKGHALGNLLLLALLEAADGGLVAALDRAGALLRCQGRVLPATTEPVQLRACIEGHEVGGQVRVATAQGTVERVWLAPEAPAGCPDSVAAITAADVVLLGPGSLFTSILATLAVPDIAAAVCQTSARVVYVANLLTQPGETAEFDATAHVDALVRHVPGLRLDTVVVHDGPAPRGAGRAMGVALRHPAVGDVLCADVASRAADGTVIGTHDPQRLAAVLEPLLPR